MRGLAEELDRPPETGFAHIGAVEMRLTPMGAGDFHGAIAEIARAATELGGDCFHVTDSLGSRVVAEVYRRYPRRRRWLRT
ncbi:hypothetical protein ACFVMC_03805 [Nocardia sp. NPDC127579]|uniref:hypothetical protein n=1 Tax=Nocardia sp. NPDC127579 TaxID=3345402 RepID=UPI003644772B